MAKEKGSKGSNANSNNIEEQAKRTQEILSETAKNLQDLFSQSAASMNIAAEALKKFNDQLGSSNENASSLSQYQEILKNIEKDSISGSQGIGSLISSLKKQAKTQKDASKAAGFKEDGDGKNNVYAQIAKSSKAAQIGIAALAGAVSLLGKALKGLTMIASGVFDIFTSMLDWVKTAIGGVINFFGNLFEGLFGMAKERLQAMLEQRRAAENIRETFGDIKKTGAGKEVLDFGKALSSGTIAGLAASKVFESVADAINYANEIASQSPEAFDMLKDQFAGAGGRNIVGFQKGLGITTEQLGQLMGVAISTGESLEGLQTEMVKYSKGLGERFGVNSKLIARSMAKAMIDVKHFAGVTKKEMAEAAVYAQKLGTSLEKITGIMDAFMTFDEAAENVSKLSQAFGVNLDVMKLLEAKTPADMLDQVKKSFNAAGKSVESMNRQELAMIARTVGLDEATVRQTLSTKNQGAALEDVKDAGNSVEKQMVSTGEALKEVSQDIKQVVRSLEIQANGFFDTFLDGIFQGVVSSTSFQKILNNMAAAIEAVFYAGKRLGQVIVSTFPGLKKILDSIAEFFNPTDLGSLFGGFTNVFQKFFNNLKKGTGDVRDLFKDLFENFKNFFLKKGPAGQQLLDGVSEFWGAVKQIISTAIDGLGDLIAGAFNKLADLIENPPTMEGGLINLEKLGKDIEESSIGQSLIRAFEKIKPAFLRLMDDIWGYVSDKLSQKFSEAFSNIWKNYKWEIVLGGLFIALNSAFSQAALAAVAIWAAREKGKSIGEEQGGEAEGALGQLVGSMASGAAIGAKLGSAVPVVGTAIGAGAGAIAGAVGETVNQVYTMYSQMESMQDSATKGLKQFENDAEQLAMRFGKKDVNVVGIEGKVSKLSFEMSDEQLLDQYAGLIGGRSWLATDEEDAKEIKKILQEKYKKALKNQESISKDAIAKDSELAKKSVVSPEDAAKKLQEEGKRMVEETARTIGETTIDNVEERIKKIQEIGKKIVGNEKEFNDQVKNIRESLAKFDFVIMDPATQAKFQEGLGGLQHVITFMETTKKTVAAIDQASKLTAGLGRADKENTLIGKFMKNIGEFMWGLKDISTIFAGGGDGKTTAIEPVKFNPNTISSIKEFDKNLGEFEENLSEITKKYQRIGEITKTDFSITTTGIANLTESMSKLASPMAELDQKAMVDSIDKWATSIESIVDYTTSKVKINLMASIDRLVAEIQTFQKSFSDALKDGFKESLDLKMTVSSDGKLAVQNPKVMRPVNNRPVVLDFKFNIQIDGAELEKVMVVRDKSIVRTVLNDMAEKGVANSGGSVLTVGTTSLGYTSGASRAGGGD